MRDISTLVGCLLNVIPAEEGTLRHHLKDVKESAKYQPPEAVGALFAKAEAHLRPISKTPENNRPDWVRVVIKLWSDYDPDNEARTYGI